ncbi:hypothetical protein Tco_0971563 [Tanacetum coccineum]
MSYPISKFKFVDEDWESSGAYIALPGLHSKMAVAERKIGLLLKLLMKSLMGRSPNISVMRHFGCSSDILNTLDHLVKFDGKSEEGYCWPLLQEERTAAKEVNLSSEVMLYMDEISWLELNGFVVTREINGLRGTIIKKKAIASCKRVRQEEGVDYDEGFAPVARIDLKQSDSFWIAFFQGFTVYQMDAKCFFVLHITGKRYMSNSPRFEDLLIHTRSTELSRHFMACIKPQEHVGRIEEISCWYKNIKPASTPIKAHKSLGKDEEGEDVDVHLYRSMIGCLMYLTASRPDIMFAVCLCARFQVTPKVSHLHGSFSDSDYAGDNHDRRSTLGGCQYLGRKIVSWPMHETNNCGISLQKQNISSNSIGAEEEQSTSPHSRATSYARDAQGTTTQSAAHSQSAAHPQSAAHSQRTASVQGTASFHDTVNSQGDAESKGLADFQGYGCTLMMLLSMPKFPMNYTPTDVFQTIWRR